MSITTDTTLAALLSADPSAAPAPEGHGLDHCCGGQQPLRHACPPA